jgi:predicted metal-binding membrane protein
LKLTAATTTERLLQRQRWIILLVLLLVSALCWIYIAAGAGTGMSILAMSRWDIPALNTLPALFQPWDAAYAVIMLAMWWLMMIAMMLPSAAPMILLYARVVRHSSQPNTPTAVVASASFAGGYLFIWLLFSVLAVLLQWALERLGALHSMMMWSTSIALSATLLLVAGLYQFSTLKTACLRHCRSPVEFISSHWRNGQWGAFRMGLAHGSYCLGCCWSLMALLFVGGAMNLVWIAGLAIVVLLEKLLPASRWFVRLSGGLLITSGILLLLSLP